MTDVMVQPTVGLTDGLDESTEDEDGKISHLVRKEDQLKAAVTGEPVEALCGKLWVPTRNDDRSLPVCSRCKEELRKINLGRMGGN